MGRELQKKKNRSSIPKKRQKPKSKKKILHNPIIAANWTQGATLRQNYKRLGLASKLNSSTGGKQKTALNVDSEGEDQDMADDTFAIKPTLQPADIEPQTVRIIRDQETGAIISVFDDEDKPNPLNDPLNDLEETPMMKFNSLGFVPKRRDGAKETDVTRQLEEYALSGIERAKRGQSKGEEEWVQNLINKYGDDYKGMFWDKKLNPMQQSVGDLKKRVKKYQERQAREAEKAARQAANEAATV
ncbi:hypothetical protein FKW77_003195 [Venturia effusa]|uniref:Nucleolar protein 16 n=1 Tax=Venturia effusa TaxID=50376 RepID=A0A517LJW7_9PEZI|nr:hypothetical protein FKW77_003195 [Venturia effusa]